VLPGDLLKVTIQRLHAAVEAAAVVSRIQQFDPNSLLKNPKI
jgi:hypothetical protein